MKTLASVRCLLMAALVCVATVVGAPPASAQLSFHLSMDTSLLVGHLAAPFYLDFQLNGGSALDAGNNRVTLRNFTFGGGAAGPGTPTLLGGASGNLASGVTITDSVFRNEFFQGFVPGSLLEFDAELSTNVDRGPTPDQFAFSILDCSLTEIPTLGNPFDAFVLVNLDSPSPRIRAFAGDPSRAPACGGGSIAVDVPSIASVPEPAAGFLFLGGLVGVISAAAGRRWRSSVRRVP